MIAVVDYGMGNLRSVLNAFAAIGQDAAAVSLPSDLKEYDGIVLPGVGAFGDGMKNLRERGFIDKLADEVLVKGKPFLGLCLGMQLLATVSFEYGEHAGLNWIPGEVRRIAPTAAIGELRVPHMGWNDVRLIHPNGLYTGFPSKETFYFVHSYVFSPNDPTVVSGICSYGLDFAASVEVGNLYATQFHPEKSHKAGITLLKNWSEKVTACSKSV